MFKYIFLGTMIVCLTLIIVINMSKIISDVESSNAMSVRVKRNLPTNILLLISGIVSIIPCIYRFFNRDYDIDFFFSSATVWENILWFILLVEVFAVAYNCFKVNLVSLCCSGFSLWGYIFAFVFQSQTILIIISTISFFLFLIISILSFKVDIEAKRNKTED